MSDSICPSCPAHPNEERSHAGLGAGRCRVRFPRRAELRVDLAAGRSARGRVGVDPIVSQGTVYLGNHIYLSAFRLREG